MGYHEACGIHKSTSELPYIDDFLTKFLSSTENDLIVSIVVCVIMLLIRYWFKDWFQDYVTEKEQKYHSWFEGNNPNTQGIGNDTVTIIVDAILVALISAYVIFILAQHDLAEYLTEGEIVSSEGVGSGRDYSSGGRFSSGCRVWKQHGSRSYSRRYYEETYDSYDHSCYPDEEEDSYY